MPLRVFLSHSSKDKHLAAQIKEQLECYGLDVFVAHADIHPSDEWQRTILKKLDRSHIFLALLTNAFQKSNWTDQETGIAVSKSREIMPLHVDVMPYGFISKHQAHKFKRSDVKESCAEIAKTIDGTQKFKRTFRRWLIDAVHHAPNFDAAIAVTRLLVDLERFNSKDVYQILFQGLHNHEVFNSIYALRNLRTFYREHKEALPEKQQRYFDTTFSRYAGR